MTRPITTTPLEKLCFDPSPDWPSIIQRIKAYPHEVKSLYVIFALLERNAPFDAINAILTAHPAAAREVNVLTGQTALHLAVSKNANPQIIRRLIQAWPKAIMIPSKYDTLNSLPLFSVKNVDTAKILVETNSNCLGMKNTAGYIALHEAAGAVNVPANVVKYLIEMGKEYSKKEGTWRLLRNRNVALGNHGGALTETTNGGMTPLSLAIDSIVERPHAKEFLTTQDENKSLSDVAAMKWEKLTYIVTAANEAQEYQIYGKNDAKGKTTPLLHAMLAMNVPEPLISYALKIHQEQLFMRDRYGNSALNVAVSNFDVTIDMVRLLLDSSSCEGSKRLARMLSNTGQLPLHTYLSKVHRHDRLNVDILKLLIASEPRAIETRDGQTGLYPFALAAVGESGDLDVTYSLLGDAPWLISRLQEAGTLQQQAQQVQQIQRKLFGSSGRLWS